jgi:hypothetical protein
MTSIELDKGAPFASMRRGGAQVIFYWGAGRASRALSLGSCYKKPTPPVQLLNELVALMRK